MKILIIGASGGIGGAILEHCQHRFPNAELHATYCSTPPKPVSSLNLVWHQLDASCETSVANLSQTFTDLDWVINCIGFLHDADKGPEKNLSSVDTHFFYQNINRNTLPTLLLAKYFSATLKKSKAPKLACLSAKVGSISDNRLGGWYSYRASKAALNMIVKTISIEWSRSLRKGVILALHPGTTDTQLSKPFQANVPPGKLFSPQKVAEDLVAIIERSTPDNSGRFYSYSGEELPW